MLIEGSVISDVGKIRQNNEDNFFLNGLYRQNMQENSFEMTQKADGRRAVYAVCDGMGGEDYGEVASLCAVSALEVFKNNKWSDGVIEGYINSVKADMTEKSRKLLSEGMGSTLALLYFEDNTAHIANMGDSRIYIYRNGKLKQLTKDHTQARLLMDNGLLKEDEARKHISSHMLTRYLGTESSVTFRDIYKAHDIKLCKEDIFLLCSDGLTDMLADNEIEEYFYKADKKDTCKIVKGLCKAALAAGGKDNITCIAARVIKKDKLFFK